MNLALTGQLSRFGSEGSNIKEINYPPTDSGPRALEACPLSSSNLKSLNYAVVSSFKKIFNVSSTEIANECMFMFGCQDISVAIENRKRKFLQKLALSNSVVWNACQEFVSRDISNIIWQHGQLA